MSMYVPTRGGQVDVAKQTKESEYTRQWFYFWAQLALRLGAVLLILLEIVLIGPGSGALFAFGALAVRGIKRMRLVLDTHELPQFMLLPKAGIQKDPIFMTGFVLSVGLTLIYLNGYWLPVEWQVRDGYLWWIVQGQPQRVLPALGTLSVWIRYILVVGMPWMVYAPGMLLNWVFRMESAFSNFRQTTFAQADPSTIDTPVGRLQTPVKRKPPAPERPASSAPIVTEQASVAIHSGGNGKDVVDL